MTLNEIFSEFQEESIEAHFWLNDDTIMTGKIVDYGIDYIAVEVTGSNKPPFIVPTRNISRIQAAQVNNNDARTTE
jgi:hypothetical protein